MLIFIAVLVLLALTVSVVVHGHKNAVRASYRNIELQYSQQKDTAQKTGNQAELERILLSEKLFFQRDWEEEFIELYHEVLSQPEKIKDMLSEGEKNE